MGTPYSLGGFKGKGKGRLPKQRPSQNKGCAVTALAFLSAPAGFVLAIGNHIFDWI